MSERRERMRRIRRDRRREARKNRSAKKTIKKIFGWILLVAAAAILGYGFVTFCYRDVYMSGSSMNPTIEDGDKCVVSRLSYYLGKPDRYDIVAYKQREDGNSYYDIKRVIGLPGETVLIENGRIYIDGTELTDMPCSDYIFTGGLADSDYTLGDEEYFLLGDNVNNSRDSRYVNIGSIKESEILGKVVKY